MVWRHDLFEIEGVIAAYLNDSFATDSLRIWTSQRTLQINRLVPCVDGSELANGIFALLCWSVQPCVRPISAGHMTAGHNALRGSGPDQKPAFENAMALGVVPIAGSTGSAFRAGSPFQLSASHQKQEINRETPCLHRPSTIAKRQSAPTVQRVIPEQRYRLLYKRKIIV